jgi:hypothetical protein
MLACHPCHLAAACLWLLALLLAAGVFGSQVGHLHGPLSLPQGLRQVSQCCCQLGLPWLWLRLLCCSQQGKQPNSHYWLAVG